MIARVRHVRLLAELLHREAQSEPQLALALFGDVVRELRQLEQELAAAENTNEGET